MRVKDRRRPWEIFENSPKCAPSGDLTHVSLFSGCGGFDLGFHQAGFKTVFANDINEDAAHTYRHNIGEICTDDIRNVALPTFKKKIDVLTAGFPCQPFSNAGSRKGLEDGRGTLYQSALDIVKNIRPRSVVFENVRGILSFKKDGKPLIQEICEELAQLGYLTTFSLIDSSKYNVPQKRLRLFIVGINKGKKGTAFTFPDPIERSDLTLKHTILDLKKKTLNQSELLQLNPQALALGELVPEGGSWKNIPYSKLPPRLKKIAENMERYRWPNFYRRFHRDEIAGTVTAAFKPENAGVWHPTEQRILSVREIARIQTFPDWFDFQGRTVKSKYQQIGNAVPPRLAFEIADQLRRVLNGVDLDTRALLTTFDDFIASGKPLRAKNHGVIFEAAARRNESN